VRATSQVLPSLQATSSTALSMFFWAALRPPSPRAPPAYGGDERPGPSPEVLGRELAARDLFHVGALVAEFDVLDLAFLVAVFEDLVTGGAAYSSTILSLLSTTHWWWCLPHLPN
jgi:hypothetical protein